MQEQRAIQGMTVAQIVDYLLQAGWREYPDQFRSYSRCLYKRFDTPTRCACNSDKAGMQVCCSVSEFVGKVSCELDLRGQLYDGTWVELKQWVLPNDIEKSLALIPRMLAAWEFMANSATVTMHIGPQVAAGMDHATHQLDL